MTAAAKGTARLCLARVCRSMARLLIWFVKTLRL